jgi:two-component system, cell cycle sensor histidine kinase and response regulator CckA
LTVFAPRKAFGIRWLLLIGVILCNGYAVKPVAAAQRAVNASPAQTALAPESPRPRPRISINRRGRTASLSGGPAIVLIAVLLLIPVLLLVRWLRARRRAQHALTRLEESEARYRLLFDRNPAPMWVYDRTTLEFLEVNAAAIDHYGYNREEFNRMSVMDIRPPDEQDRLRVYLATASATELTFFTGRHLRKDGSVIDVEIRSHALDIPGRDARLVMVTDITERTRLQEQLLQSQKMEAIGQLAGGIAHDFNNLLTVVTGYSSILLSDLPPDDVIRDDVQQIQSAAERATALTRQLLAFSRRQVLQPKVFDLNALIGEVGRMLRRLLREDIQIVTQLAPELSHINADPHHVEQVIMNLALNSQDAMPSGGRILIETSNVVLDEEHSYLHAEAKPGAYTVLSCTDTGAGMAPEVRTRVFEPFFTTKPKGKGTGLGLSTVYGTVKQSGGYISVYSEAGRGTTFKIYFPSDDSPAEVEPKLALGTEFADAESGMTILVADDEDAVRKAVCRILIRFGYKVLEAENGAVALGILDSYSGSIALVLSDLVMPVMGGREIVSALRERGSNIPILLMSGYNESAALSNTGLEHNVPFLNKPFTPESLIGKVREVRSRA